MFIISLKDNIHIQLLYKYVNADNCEIDIMDDLFITYLHKYYEIYLKRLNQF